MEEKATFGCHGEALNFNPKKRKAKGIKMGTSDDANYQPLPMISDDARSGTNGNIKTCLTSKGDLFFAAVAYANTASGLHDASIVLGM